MLLTKNEAKDTKERQEWKIAVLTDMRDKLQRGESIEEEEALLSVGMDRSTREEQVDDKYFEDRTCFFFFFFFFKHVFDVTFLNDEKVTVR